MLGVATFSLLAGCLGDGHLVLVVANMFSDVEGSTACPSPTQNRQFGGDRRHSPPGIVTFVPPDTASSENARIGFASENARIGFGGWDMGRGGWPISPPSVSPPAPQVGEGGQPPCGALAASAARAFSCLRIGDSTTSAGRFGSSRAAMMYW